MDPTDLALPVPAQARMLAMVHSPRRCCSRSTCKRIERLDSHLRAYRVVQFDLGA